MCFQIKNIFFFSNALTYYSVGVVVVNSYVVRLAPGANPTITSNNASVVKIYNATKRIASFLSKNYFSQMHFPITILALLL
jgi:hypothetical protein